MNRSIFDKLVCHLSPKLLVGNKGGKMKVSVEKQLLIYIKYASSQKTLTEISDTYGVCEGTAHCIIHRTSSLICADMLSNLITWPSGLKVQENVEKVYQHILWVAGVSPLLKSFKKTHLCLSKHQKIKR